MRTLVLVCAWALAAFAVADTFDDIMYAHRQALSRLTLSKELRDKISGIDTDFEKSMRSDLNELVHTERGSAKRNDLVKSMKSKTSTYKETLRSILGTKWSAYQRAYAVFNPPTQKTTEPTSAPTKKGRAKPTSKKKKTG